MGEVIETAKLLTVAAKNRILRTFSHVPDEKLTWTPAPSSKSALRIAAHIGVSNYGMSAVLRGDHPPVSSMQELMKFMSEKELSVTSRDEAVKAIESSTEHYLATLDTLTHDRLKEDIVLPFGTFPTIGFIFVCGRHMESHSAQIDYLQTMWGDLDPYF